MTNVLNMRVKKFLQISSSFLSFLFFITEGRKRMKRLGSVTGFFSGVAVATVHGIHHGWIKQLSTTPYARRVLAPVALAGVLGASTLGNTIFDDAWYLWGTYYGRTSTVVSLPFGITH